MKSKTDKIIIKKSEDPFLDPRCCTYKLSGDIRAHVESLINDDEDDCKKEIDKQAKSILIDLMNEDEANKNTLTYDSLVKLHKYLQRADKNFLQPFYQFSEACTCIKPKPRENKQLAERLNLLRFKDSQALYDQMTSSVDKSVEDKMEKIIDGDMDGKKIGRKDGDLSTYKVYSNSNIYNNGNQSTTSEFKRLNGSIVAVFNSFLVFICTFIFCYKALEYSLEQPNIVAQTLFGIGGSTIVAIAELYFLIRVV